MVESFFAGYVKYRCDYCCDVFIMHEKIPVEQVLCPQCTGSRVRRVTF